MKHISDVWKFLEQFHTEESLEKAFGEIPNKFGIFDIINHKTYKEDGFFEICNSYFDENVGDYDYVYHTIDVEE